MYETNTCCVAGRIFRAIVWPATILLFQELPSDTSDNVHVGSERQATKYHLSTFANSAGLRAGCALGFVAFDEAILSILGINGCRQQIGTCESGQCEGDEGNQPWRHDGNALLIWPEPVKHGRADLFKWTRRNWIHPGIPQVLNARTKARFCSRASRPSTCQTKASISR
jgi:hypothetical protein